MHPEHYDEGHELRRDRQDRGPARRRRRAPRRASPTGNYVAPTVFADVAPDARIFQEEIFGPVVAITPFDTDEEALALANDVRYGLAAYVWTNDLTRAHNFAQDVEAGMVWLNSQQRARPAHPVRRRQGLRPRPRGRLPLDRLLHRPAGRAHHARPGAHTRPSEAATCMTDASSTSCAAAYAGARRHRPRGGRALLRRRARPRRHRGGRRTPIYLRSLEEFIHHNLVLRTGPVAAVAALRLPGAHARGPRPRPSRSTRSSAAGSNAERRGLVKGIGDSVRVEDPLGFPYEFFYDVEHVERLAGATTCTAGRARAPRPLQPGHPRRAAAP